VHVVDVAGRARVWGYNFAGELGLGFLDDQPPYFIFTPTILEPPRGLKWKQIVSSAPSMSGPKVHFGLANDGSLWGWGYNGGQIFRLPVSSVFRAVAPIKIPFPPGVDWWRKVACNQNVVGGIDQNGNIWSWGRNIGTTKLNGSWTDLRVSNSRFIALTATNTLVYANRQLTNFRYAILTGWSSVVTINCMCGGTTRIGNFPWTTPVMSLRRSAPSLLKVWNHGPRSQRQQTSA
jgi:alpha-tubulin suppressor-like RCC1 family protein